MLSGDLSPPGGAAAAFPVMVDDDDIGEVMNIDEWRDVDVDVILDSGCCMHVLPGDCIPGYHVEASPGSKRGANFVVGNGEMVPNEGQAHLNLEASTGDGGSQLVQSTFQVAELTKPLMSVSQICAKGHKCVFEGDHATVIADDCTTLCKFQRQNGLYVTTMKLKAPSPFGRQDP